MSAPIFYRNSDFLCGMNTIGEVFMSWREALQSLYDPKEIEAIALLVTETVCGLSRAKIKAFPETVLPAGAQEKLNAILKELKTGKPVQYILGETEFFGLTFKVNPSVLIPRPETEELVEWAIASARELSAETGSILDIGTGSGCIAVSLKKNLPEYKVSAIDISPNALQTARENAKINETEINFIKADILQPDLLPGEKFSIIVSNPPYVTLRDKTLMHRNVVDFEPHTALFVPEDDPLIFYKAIADFARFHLCPGGLLLFEINESYGEALVELLTQKSFRNIELRRDITGRDRMIKASIDNSSTFNSSDETE